MLLVQVLFLALYPGAEALAQARNRLEYAVKATYLYKFASYVQWPEGTFSSSTAPLHLCVAGDDPFGGILVDATRGQTVDGRSIVVDAMRTVTLPLVCHIVFVMGSRNQSVAAMLRLLDGLPILTVTDGGPGFPFGSVINFTVKNRHVRFDVDQDAAKKNGLVISSKLLDVAQVVYGGGTQ
jgi:hypothetical protein